jgi:hypothetical protein
MIIYLQAITSSIECRLSVTAIRMQEIPPENLKQEFIVIFDCGIRKIQSGLVGI